ncbi:MAG: hypothetical protein IJT97_11245 [Bacteroidaceae bacterium]|nr:hypothetical protein [Bacteroidaceae bacterium]
MIHLYIDKQEVRLPDNIEIDYYVYNPFFERKGGFTYDISISLKDGANAKVYGHIQRWNRNTKPGGRTAELYDNEKLLVRGLEVILSVEDYSVKIQIVSDNSELNYLAADGEKRLRDLDLGYILTFDRIQAKGSLYYTSALYNYVCPPIARVLPEMAVAWFSDEDRAARKMFNNLRRPGHNQGDPNHPRQDYELDFADTPNLRAQPYLVAIVEKVVTALGYSVTCNALREDEVLSQVYIVNSKDTVRYNEMVPNWLVNDFLDEVEKWGNVVFLIDKLTKTCRIVNVHEFYASAGFIYVGDDKVVDEVEKEYNQSPDDEVSYRNMSYKFPGGVWYKYANLGSKKMQQCWQVDVNRGMAGYGVSIRDSLEGKGIVHYTDIELDLVGRKWETGSDVMGTQYYWRPVNILKDVLLDERETKMEFRIVPVPTVGLSLYGRYWRGEGDGTAEVAPCTVIPYAQDQGESEGDDSEMPMQDLIEGTAGEESVADYMPVAVYNGIRVCHYQSEGFSVPENYPRMAENLKFPLSTVTNATMVRTATSGTNFLIFFDGEVADKDLRLTSLYKRLYSKNYSINTQTIHKAFFYAEEILDPKQIFVIKNRRFYCKFLLYKIDKNGLKRLVEGNFFEM